MSVFKIRDSNKKDKTEILKTGTPVKTETSFLDRSGFTTKNDRWRGRLYSSRPRDHKK